MVIRARIHHGIRNHFARKRCDRLVLLRALRPLVLQYKHHYLSVIPHEREEGINPCIRLAFRHPECPSLKNWIFSCDNVELCRDMEGFVSADVFASLYPENQTSGFYAIADDA